MASDTRNASEYQVYARRILGIVPRYPFHALACVLFLFSQYPLLARCWMAWGAKDTYYSHGPLVPVLACAMLWLDRRRILRAGIHPTLSGLPLLITGILVTSVATLISFPQFHIIGFFIAGYGLILALLGWPAMKALFLPVLFLSTMMPISDTALDYATGRFQIMSSIMAAKALTLVDSSIVQNGNVITSDNLPGALIVGTPCSGLKLLIALITTSWFLAYITQGSSWRKLALVGMSLPLSIAVNTLRIFLIGCVGLQTFSTESMHSFHDYSGYIGLGVCAVLTYCVSRLLGLRDLRDPQALPVLGTDGMEKQPYVRFRAVLATTIAALAIGGTTGVFCTPLYGLRNGSISQGDIPTSFGNWQSQDLEIDADTREKLKTAGLLSRVYSDWQNGTHVQVFVDASYDLVDFHDPHVCLPGSGASISQEKRTVIDLGIPEVKPVNASVLKTSDAGGGQSLIVFWYMLAGKSVSAPTDLRIALRWFQLDGLGKLLRNPTGFAETKREINSHQMVWYRFSVPLTNEQHDMQELRRFMSEFARNTRGFNR